MAWSTLVVVGLWLTCLSLLFLAVGFAIPFWAVFPAEDASSNVYFNVWYVMICIKGRTNSCTSAAVKPKFTSNSSLTLTFAGTNTNNIILASQTYFGYLIYWWVIQILTSIAIGFASLATLVLIYFRCVGIHSREGFIISAILLLFGGLTGLSVSILAAITVANLKDFPHNNVTGETFPWSILLFGIGSIIALAACTIVMIVSCCWQKYGRYRESDKESLRGDTAPMSTLSTNISNDRYWNRPRQTHGYSGTDDSELRFGYGKNKISRHDSGYEIYRGHDNTSYDYRNNDDGNYGTGYQDNMLRHNGSYERSRDTTANAVGYEPGHSKSRLGHTMYRPYSDNRY